jgi:hypothetical protein
MARKRYVYCPGCGADLEGTTLVWHVIKVYHIDYPPRQARGHPDNLKRIVNFSQVVLRMAEHLKKE